MKNTDAKCFLWSVLAGLHPVAANPARVSHYRAFEKELDLSGIEFPVRACKRTFERFERQNPGVSLSVFVYDAGSVVPKYVDGLNSRDLTATPCDLLLLDDGGDFGHYVLIRSLSRLLSSSMTQGDGAQHVCRRCLYHTRDASKFETHRSIDCGGLSGLDGPLVVRVPDPAKDETSIRFKALEKMMPAPYTVYADFEAINRPLGRRAGTSTEHKTEHVPCSAAYLIIGPARSVYGRGLYRGEDPAGWLIGELQRHHRDICDAIREGQQPPRLKAGRAGLPGGYLVPYLRGGVPR